MHEDRGLQFSHTVFLGYWGYSGYGELRGRRITASNFQLIIQEALFIQAMHHVHIQKAAETLCICNTLCYKK